LRINPIISTLSKKDGGKTSGKDHPGQKKSPRDPAINRLIRAGTPGLLRGGHLRQRRRYDEAQRVGQKTGNDYTRDPQG